MVVCCDAVIIDYMELYCIFCCEKCGLQIASSNDKILLIHLRNGHIVLIVTTAYISFLISLGIILLIL